MRAGTCGPSAVVGDPVAKRLSVATGDVGIGTGDNYRNGIDSSYIAARAGECLPLGYASVRHYERDGLIANEKRASIADRIDALEKAMKNNCRAYCSVVVPDSEGSSCSPPCSPQGSYGAMLAMMGRSAHICRVGYVALCPPRCRLPN